METKTYTTKKELRSGYDFYFFHQGCIYLIENTVKTVIMWNIITIWNNCFLFEYIIYLYDAKLNFQQPLLQSSVSHEQFFHQVNTVQVIKPPNIISFYISCDFNFNVFLTHIIWFSAIVFWTTLQCFLRVLIDTFICCEKHWIQRDPAGLYLPFIGLCPTERGMARFRVGPTPCTCVWVW